MASTSTPTDPDGEQEVPTRTSSHARASAVQSRLTAFFDPEHQTTEPEDIAPVSARDNDDASSAHIRVESPEPRPRPSMPTRNTFKGSSAKNMHEALRIARRREEQETLLEDHEEADDDGCYPPRQNNDPRTPNPHSHLPVYTSIHRIRRLVIASIGQSVLHFESPHAHPFHQTTHIAPSNSRVLV
jgi:hypothetical protein